ncbi:hypothetical protein [Mesorhizobium sp. WSM3876]|uniref:hypothetical protein n=1 Tax=Mesorhizobium sp. WSM3876 TaxID=422277 RepID=UPI001140FA5D|nr:hypothetical protein [Mesorhizobium sp. WSM3876]
MKPFAAFDTETRYGTVSLRTASGIRKYPVNQNARLSILLQLECLCSFRKPHKPHSWIYFYTLDNKLVLSNLQYAKSIELIGDDVEAMPCYYPPEIYRALDDLDTGEISDSVKTNCQAVIADIGDEKAMRIVSFVRITYDAGEDEWNFLDKGTANTFFGLEAATFEVPPHTLAQIEEEGYYRARYANLDRVAVIEIPSDRYHRLTRTRSRSKPIKRASQLSRAPTQLPKKSAGAARED